MGLIEGRPSTSPTPPPKTVEQEKELRTTSVLCVYQTRGGELANRLKAVEARLIDVTGFRIKVVENGGTKLQQLLPNTNPMVWENV